jgi:hypothetical protein
LKEEKEKLHPYYTKAEDQIDESFDILQIWQLHRRKGRSPHVHEELA